MGTILQERVPQQCLEKVCVRDWKKTASWSNNRPNVSSNKMGRRQSQRKAVQPQHTSPSQENNNNEKRLQQRRKHKSNTPSIKYSAKGSCESKANRLSPGEYTMELKVQPAARRCGHRQQKHTGFGAIRRTPVFPCHRLSESSLDLLDRHSPKLEIGSLRGDGDDSDSDLSEAERLPVLPSARFLPKLDLRPEVVEGEDCSTHSHRPRRQMHGAFSFPDFLPPPFNSWSLSQLAVFYNMEGRGAPRPRPVGTLEKYLERLLQLEWHQLQTVQEENGKSAVADVLPNTHRPAATSSSRLSSPKCILQCQRAFPLTFLSSLGSHSALLSSCACTACRIHYSTCSMSCCRSTHSHGRQSRVSPVLERRKPVSLPKRSYSESRVHSSDRSSGSQIQNISSPVRAISHLQRMQASGNIRNPAQGASNKPHTSARDVSAGVGNDCRGAWGNVMDCRTRVFRKRSGSEQQRRGVERQQNGSEKKRSGSVCRIGGSERRRTDEFKEQEIKPDAVTAIMHNLPGSKHSPVNRPNKPKQVEFVT